MIRTAAHKSSTAGQIVNAVLPLGHMSLIDAERLAAWVETHDDGTPAPRALIRRGPCGHYVVIRSTVVLADGETDVDTDVVNSLGEARAVLGY